MVMHMAHPAGGIDIDDADPGPLRTRVDAKNAGHAAHTRLPKARDGRWQRQWQETAGVIMVRIVRSPAAKGDR
ncbi:hypothetical protein KMM349_31320 [Stenotrophomonas maltophilia]|nr:hypothetical protein KMM349_31320 [Stenotrophomonas maltophilia]